MGILAQPLEDFVPAGFFEEHPDVALIDKYDVEALIPLVRDRFGLSGPAGAIVATALYDAGRIDKRVSYSRAAGYWSGPERKNQSSRLSLATVTRAFDTLDASGWIDHDKRKPRSPEAGPAPNEIWRRQSSAKATPRFLSEFAALLRGVPRLKLLKPRHLILLRFRRRDAAIPRNRKTPPYGKKC